MSDRGSPIAGIRPARWWWLLPVAALLTIANERVAGAWHAIIGVVIGMLWISLGAAFLYGTFIRGRRANRQKRERLERVIASGDPATAARASSDLGVLLALKGDSIGARDNFQRAIDSGQPEPAAMAAFNLGLMHHRAGQLEAAIPGYQRAVDSGHPTYRPVSANNLGQVFRELGRIGEARATYQIAAGSTIPEQVEIAMKALAEMGNRS